MPANLSILGNMVPNPGFYSPIGAVGDGVNDDTLALQSALNQISADGGGVLVLPPATYKFTSLLKIRSNTMIQATDPRFTILQWSGATGTDAVQVVGSQVDIMGVQIIGSCGAGAGKLVNIQNVNDIRIENCWFNSTGTSGTDGAALFIGNINRVRVKDTKFSSSAFFCVYHNSSAADDDVVFDNVRCSSTYAGGLPNGALMQFSSAQPCTRFRVLGGQLGPAPGNGVNFQNGYVNPQVGGNILVVGCTRLGIEMSNGVVRATITDAIVDFTGSTPGPTCWGASISGDQARVDGLTVRGVGAGVTYGLEVVNCTDAAISNIDIENVGVGIINNNSPRTAFSSLVIDTTQTTGLRIFGGNAGGKASDDCSGSGITIRNIGQAAADAGVTAGIEIDASAGSAKRCNFSAFVIDGGAKPAGASAFRGIYSNDIDNKFGPGVVRNLTGVDNNGKMFGPFGIGRIEGVVGVNPYGIQTPPAMPASTVALVNPFWFPCDVYVAGGTLTDIKINGTSVSGVTSDTIHLDVGDSITITYTVAPSWQWKGN